MSWSRRRGELVRQIRRAIKWCRQRRAPRGGESRWSEMARRLQRSLDNIDDAHELSNLLICLGQLAEELDRDR